MRKYLACGIAAALLACLTALPASAGTFIANSGNGAYNTIAVSNGGAAGPTRILNSGNGAYNTIAVQNLGGFTNPTVIRNSANGVGNTIAVTNR